MSANRQPSEPEPGSTSQSSADLFLCSKCDTTIEGFIDLARHLLHSCSYATESQIAEAQGFACHTCDKTFSQPQEFEAHLIKKKRHMRVRGRKSKRKTLPQYNHNDEPKRGVEYLSTPLRRPASSPLRHNSGTEFETPTRPAPRSEPISPSLEEVIGVEDCTMHCRQCKEDFPTVEALVDHFADVHGEDTIYCYTCAETFPKAHLLWPHLYTSPRHENAPPQTMFEFSSTTFHRDALTRGQRCSGEAPIDMSGANETRKVSRIICPQTTQKLTRAIPALQRRISRVKLRPDKPARQIQHIHQDMENNPFS